MDGWTLWQTLAPYAELIGTVLAAAFAAWGVIQVQQLRTRASEAADRDSFRRSLMERIRHLEEHVEGLEKEVSGLHDENHELTRVNGLLKQRISWLEGKLDLPVGTWVEGAVPKIDLPEEYRINLETPRRKPRK